MSQLGTLEELPLEYRNGLTSQNLVPLWPNLRAALPYNIPSRRTKPMVWRYADIRPELLKAGDLTPIEKAERRVLVLANPGLGLENMLTTPSIYIGMQLILPRETAPNHWLSAERCAFRRGRRGRFHCHRRRENADGKGRPDPGTSASGTSTATRRRPIVWLDHARPADGLCAGNVYCLDGEPQKSEPAGLLPDALSPRRPRALRLAARAASPPSALSASPWKDTRAALHDLATVTDKATLFSSLT
ncbi:MAG: hypothetical protein U1E19_10095 [Rhodoblastus sp.]